MCLASLPLAQFWNCEAFDAVKFTNTQENRKWFGLDPTDQTKAWSDNS